MFARPFGAAAHGGRNHKAFRVVGDHLAMLRSVRSDRLALAIEHGRNIERPPARLARARPFSGGAPFSGPDDVLEAAWATRASGDRCACQRMAGAMVAMRVASPGKEHQPGTNRVDDRGEVRHGGGKAGFASDRYPTIGTPQAVRRRVV